MFGGGEGPARKTKTESTEGPRVSGNRYWRCPACGGVQGKRDLDTAYVPGAPIAAGATVACSKCGREHDAGAVYGGNFDFTGEQEVLSRTQVAQRYLEAEMAQDGNALEALLATDA